LLHAAELDQFCVVTPSHVTD